MRIYLHARRSATRSHEGLRKIAAIFIVRLSNISAVVELAARVASRAQLPTTKKELDEMLSKFESNLLR